MTKSCLYTDHASSGRLPEVKKKQIIKPPSKKWSPQSLIRDVRLQHLTLTGKIFLLGGWSVLGGGRVVMLVCNEFFGSAASFLEKKVALHMFIFQAELRRNIGLLQAEVQKKDGMLQYVSCSPRIKLSLHFVMRCDKW